MVRKINEFQQFGKRNNPFVGTRSHPFRPVDQVLRNMNKSPIYYSDVAKENIYEANKQAHKVK